VSGAIATRRLTRYADAVRVGLLGAAVGFMVADEKALAIKTLLVLPPAAAGRLLPVHPGFDLIFALALAGEIVATALGTYDTIGTGDTLSHLVLPLLSAPILYAALTQVSGPSGRALARPLGAGLATGTAVLGLGIAWELVEWASDVIFRTAFSQGSEDTIVDLLNDAIAAVVGGALVALWLWRADRKQARVA
jgi:hypothetical protein